VIQIQLGFGLGACTSHTQAADPKDKNIYMHTSMKAVHGYKIGGE